MCETNERPSTAMGLFGNKSSGKMNMGSISQMGRDAGKAQVNRMLGVDEEEQEGPGSLKRKWKVVTVITIIFLIIVVVGSLFHYGYISKITDAISGVASDIPGLSGNSANSEDSESRACTATESLCPADGNCMSVNGSITSALATTPTGDKCCQFKCERESVPTRACLQSEVLCGVGQACMMGTSMQMPTAVTQSGQSCCAFACNSTGSLPTRTCFSSESVCEPGSFCRDHRGEVVIPRAMMNNGYVCCQYSGQNGGNACVPRN